jgi:hypothetical protein
MQKIQNLGSCVLDAQGSRKHEGEWANKPGSQYQAWRNTLTHIKIVSRYNGTRNIYVSLGTIMETLALFLLLLLILILRRGQEIFLYFKSSRQHLGST